MSIRTTFYLLMIRNTLNHFEKEKVSTKNFSLKDMGYEKIPEDKYLVLGDNREDSKDSRQIGLISKKDIIGRVSLRVWPLNKIGFVK